MKKVGIAVLALTVLLAVYYGLKKQENTQQESESQSKQLVRLELNKVNELTIVRRENHPSIVAFEQRGEDWWMIHPESYRADQVALSGLATQFGNKTYDRVFDADNGFAYRLDPAKFTVTWTTDAGTETILVGKTTPVGNNLYAARQGEAKVMVASSGFTYNLEKSLDDYKSKDVFWEYPTSVSSIHFVTEDTEWRIVRRGELWFSDEVSLDTSKVEPLLTRIEELRIRDYDHHPQLDQPEYAVSRSIIIEGAGSVKLEFAGQIEDKNTYRMNIVSRDEWVTISDYVYKNLWKTPDDLAYPEPEPAHVTAMTPLDAVEIP